MQGRVLHQAFNKLGQKLSAYRPYSEYHKPQAPFSIPIKKLNNVHMVVSACGTGRATPMVSVWMKNLSNQDWILLSRYFKSAILNVRITTSAVRPFNLTIIAWGLRSLATSKCEAARSSSSPIKILALCLTTLTLNLIVSLGFKKRTNGSHVRSDPTLAFYTLTQVVQSNRSK